MRSIMVQQQAPAAPSAAEAIQANVRQIAADAIREARAATQAATQAEPRVVHDYAQMVRDAVEANAPIPPPPPGVRVVVADGQRIIMAGDVVEVVSTPGGGAATEVPPFPPMPPQPQIPEEAVIISIAFFIMVAVIVVGWPIARALGRRMDRQQQTPPQKVVTESAAAIQRIEQAVDTLALEMERVSENQRFVTKLLADRQLAPAERQPEGHRS